MKKAPTPMLALPTLLFLTIQLPEVNLAAAFKN
jgi:hypothetical protein